MLDSTGMNTSIHTTAGGSTKMRNVVRVAIAAALALMSVAGIGGVGIAAPAGSIGGRVQTDNGTPISGAHVVAYYWETGVLAGQAYTSADGSYSIAGLTLPRYGVKADAAGFLPEHYGEGGVIPVVVFAPYGVNNIDFTLTPSSSISGHVYQADGLTPIAGARVVAYRKVGDAWDYTADGYADTEGSYSIAVGTGAGTYKVKGQAAGYAAEYHSSVLDPAEVVEIYVTAGGCIAGVNFSLSQTGFISGTAYRADGVTPMSGVRIVAYDSAGGSVEEGFSGANAGQYYINLSPGTYRLRAEGSGYVAEWHADATTFSAATPVSVVGLNETPDVNFTLDPVMSITTLRAFDITETSARLTGHLTSLGSASEVVVSFAWKPATGSSVYETPRQVRDGQGYISFSLSGLAPGVTYYYRAKTVGGADTVYGEERSFTTVDETAPVMSQPICRATSSVSTVMWVGNELTKCKIDYGLTEDYELSTGWSPDFVTGHTVRLIDLGAGSTYHYRITCTDTSGNETVSGDHSFTTDAISTTTASPVGMPWWTAGCVGLAVLALASVVYVMIRGRYRDGEGRDQGFKSDHQT